MIYLTLFLTFLKIGAVSFGGGYGMISLIRETVLENAWLTEENAWLTEEEFLNFIAVAESTPGPLAVNMATFIGSAQAGFLGAFVATLGVVLPSFVIILIIAALIKNLLKYAGVKSVLSGIRPTIVGLILATALTMFITQIFGFTSVGDGFSFDWRALSIFLIIAAVAILWQVFKKRQFSPILLILLSGGLGILVNVI